MRSTKAQKSERTPGSFVLTLSISSAVAMMTQRRLRGEARVSYVSKPGEEHRRSSQMQVLRAIDGRQPLQLIDSLEPTLRREPPDELAEGKRAVLRRVVRSREVVSGVRPRTRYFADQLDDAVACGSV